MDSGDGNFERITPLMAAMLADEAAMSPAPKGVPSVFTIGEEIEIKNSRFKVAAIGKNFMRLQLLPRMKEESAK